MTNSAPSMSYATRTPIKKNPKHGYLNIKKKGSDSYFFGFPASFIKTFIFNVIITNKTHDFSFTFKKKLKHAKTSLKDHDRNQN